MDDNALRRAVTEAFARTGADTPPWPDPHADRDVRDEEYERCTRPEKYRILAARAQAWSRALRASGLAVAEEAVDPAKVWRGAVDVPVVDAVRLRPARADALPLVFGYAAVDGVPRTALVIGAGEPAVQVGLLPDCGCDACDDGSDSLLEAVDELVTAVVTGAFTHVDAGRGRAIVATGNDDWSASDWDDERFPVGEALAAARAGRSPYEVVRGAPWAEAEGGFRNQHSESDRI
ncbi:DUF6226 family protein [Streptomyces sp. NPDC046939]|uniref:DUF6226 family protein n=1 Tax=Streptomyces sp. NPDC046939 TaxID=3155376 RepID=UPI0033CCD9C8